MYISFIVCIYLYCYPEWGCPLTLTARYKSISPHPLSVFKLVVWTLALSMSPCTADSDSTHKFAFGCRWSALMAEGGVPTAREWQKGLGLQVCLLLMLLLYLAMLPLPQLSCCLSLVLLLYHAVIPFSS